MGGGGARAGGRTGRHLPGGRGGEWGPWVYQTRIQTSPGLSFLLPQVRDWLREARVPRLWTGALVAPHRPKTCHSLVVPWAQALSLLLYCCQLGHLSHRAWAPTCPLPALSWPMHPGLNCLTQGLRLLWAGAEEGVQPCREPIFSGPTSLAMETALWRPGNYPGWEF